MVCYPPHGCYFQLGSMADSAVKPQRSYSVCHNVYFQIPKIFQCKFPKIIVQSSLENQQDGSDGLHYIR